MQDSCSLLPVWSEVAVTSRKARMTFCLGRSAYSASWCLAPARQDRMSVVPPATSGAPDAQLVAPTAEPLHPGCILATALFSDGVGFKCKLVLCPELGGPMQATLAAAGVRTVVCTDPVAESPERFPHC